MPPAAYRSASDADLTEKIRPVVQARERITHGSLEHVALKPLVVRVEPHQLEHRPWRPVERGRRPRAGRAGCAGIVSPFTRRAVRAAQVGDLDDAFLVDRQPARAVARR